MAKYCRRRPFRKTETWSALLVVALFACGEPPISHGEVGTPAPNYAAISLGGDSVALADLRGEPVLLNIWATWCPPCRKEMPDLQALYESYGPRGLQVVGVSIDGPNAEPQIREFLDEYGITFRILHDPSDRISSTFAIQGVPVTMVIDPQGTVTWRHLGPVTANTPSLLEAIESALE